MYMVLGLCPLIHKRQVSLAFHFERLQLSIAIITLQCPSRKLRLQDFEQFRSWQKLKLGLTDYKGF